MINLALLPVNYKDLTFRVVDNGYIVGKAHFESFRENIHKIKIGCPLDLEMCDKLNISISWYRATEYFKDPDMKNLISDIYEGKILDLEDVRLLGKIFKFTVISEVKPLEEFL